MTPKQRAHAAVAKAIKDGRLDRPGACTLCGSTDWTCHHHASYQPADALHVVTLCRSCHCLVHSGRIPDPGAAVIDNQADAIRWPMPNISQTGLKRPKVAVRASRHRDGVRL